jgi:hypothetical protein
MNIMYVLLKFQNSSMDGNSSPCIRDNPKNKEFWDSEAQINKRPISPLQVYKCTKPLRRNQLSLPTIRRRPPSTSSHAAEARPDAGGGGVRPRDGRRGRRGVVAGPQDRSARSLPQEDR